MDYTTLLSYKTNLECQNLDETILNNLLKLFNIKNIKQNNVKNLNKIKNNTKINLKKNLNENKFLFILNKINNNIDSIINDFLSKVKLEEELYDYFYNKIIKDINFLDSYVLFLLKLVPILKYKLNVEPTIFINNIYENLTNDDDTIRLNNYKLILKLVECDFFNNDIIDYISNTIIENGNGVDIHFWFSHNNNINKYKQQLLTMEYKNTRDKLLIHSLFDNNIINNNVNIVIDEEDINSNKDEFIILIENILEEYKYLQSFDEIKYFMEEECTTDDKKNIFINYIKSSSDNTIKKLLQKI